MLTLHTKLPHGGAQAAPVDGRLVLPYELREKCRLRAKLASGEEVAVFTVRGTVLRDGDLLSGEDGRVVLVVAAPEPTYYVTCTDPLALLRCAFHLGNRHTQAQVGEGFLRIRADPVLKDMLAGLGARIDEQDAAFEPEAGAYGGGHGHHDHGHPLAPIPLRQKIHRPGDAEKNGGAKPTPDFEKISGVKPGSVPAGSGVAPLGLLPPSGLTPDSASDFSAVER